MTVESKTLRFIANKNHATKRTLSKEMGISDNEAEDILQDMYIDGLVYKRLKGGSVQYLLTILGHQADMRGAPSRMSNHDMLELLFRRVFDRANYNIYL